MAVQMTVIGLGQIGTSIGLALAGRTDVIYRVGHDHDRQVMKQAREMNAFDATQFNLPTAVEKADVVVLCLPLDQVEETLKYIAADLREDAVVLDFSPLKEVAAGWFASHVPAGRHYVGLIPAINPQLMDEKNHGITAASANLFQHATIGITAPHPARPEALKLAEDVVRLLGSEPLFLDLLEADGLMMTAHFLPQVLSVALLHATVGLPGWMEARRFAGRPYARVSSALTAENSTALGLALQQNPARTANALNLVIGALTHLRDAVLAADGPDLQKRLQTAEQDLAAWEKDRFAANWNQEGEKPAIDPGEWVKRLFLGQSLGKK